MHFSVQTNHWHAICEAEGAEALAAAIKGLNVRIARVINKRLGRKGQVVEDRYHFEVLRTPTQVRNAVRYVLRNGEKHGVHVAVRYGDPRPCPVPLSSAAWYAYWKEGELNVLAAQSAATVVRPAQCFLLREGLLRVERASLLDAPPGREKSEQRPVERPVERPGQQLGQRAQGCAAEVGMALAFRRPTSRPGELPATDRSSRT